MWKCNCCVCDKEIVDDEKRDEIVVCGWCGEECCEGCIIEWEEDGYSYDWCKNCKQPIQKK